MPAHADARRAGGLRVPGACTASGMWAWVRPLEGVSRDQGARWSTPAVQFARQALRIPRGAESATRYAQRTLKGRRGTHLSTKASWVLGFEQVRYAVFKGPIGRVPSIDLPRQP